MRPKFYSPNRAGDLYLTRDEKILAEATNYKKNFKKVSGSERIALFIIDPEIDFCLPGGSLYVQGAEADTARLCEFIYDNMQSIGRVYCCLDTHKAYQIFFSSFWQNEKGDYPNHYTVITAKDIKTGKWSARGGASDTAIALAYVEMLEQTENYALIIWPFHSRKASVGQAIVPLLSETLLFYELMTDTDVIYKEKGGYSYTENYSVFSPEVKQVTISENQLTLGRFDDDFMTEILSYDRIYVAGQASSHCIKATLEDILHYIRANELDAAVAQKFYILEDCMSPVSAASIDFPAIAKRALEKFANSGMKVISSTVQVNR